MLRPEMDLVGRDNLQHILAIRLDNIGDVIMLGPALRSLRAALPQAHISLLASPAGSQAAALLPWIDQVITWRAVWQELSSSSEFGAEHERQLLDILHKGQYDAAFIFTSFSQSPFPPAYACYLAEIPIRIGHSKEFGGQTLTHAGSPPPDSGHQVDRNLALTEMMGFPTAGSQLELHIPQEAVLSADNLLAQASLDPHEPFILLAPGASCSARRYDPHRFAEVARSLPALTGLPVVIVGSQREAETIGPVIRTADQVGPGAIISLVGQTTVLELAALIRRSKLVIANNSASLHMADAFNRPMVILYSGTEYLTQWEPRNAPSRLLKVPTDCSPCYSFQCPFSMECLDISPEDVLESCLSLLQKETKSEIWQVGVGANKSV
jgi:lipopolysaccharide heptosyltransferase II